MCSRNWWLLSPLVAGVAGYLHEPLVLSAVQVLRDRLAADGEKHLIAKTSEFGWRLVSSMEGLEGQVGRISMTTLRKSLPGSPVCCGFCIQVLLNRGRGCSRQVPEQGEGRP